MSERARGVRLAEALARKWARLAEALARRRVTLGFLVGAVVLWLAHPTRTTLLTGAGVAIAGEAFRFWAAGHLNKSREVTSSGPYRWCAHPLYVGSGVMGIGLAIASASVIVAVLVVAYLAVTLTAAVKSEEAFLRGKFGRRYESYRRGALPEDGKPQRFSLAQAMANREHRAVAGLALAVLLLALRGRRGV